MQFLYYCFHRSYGLGKIHEIHENVPHENANYLRRNLPEMKLTSAIKSIFSFAFCTYLVKELPKSFGGPKRGEAFIDIELLPLSSVHPA